MKKLSLIAVAFVAFFASVSCFAAGQGPRLSLTTSPHYIGDVAGATNLYWTDGVSILLVKSGPWPANSQRDVFVSAVLCDQPWMARVGGNPPAPAGCSGDYVGSINVDGNGQLNMRLSPDGATRADVWNATNQDDIDVGVFTASPSNLTITTQSTNWQLRSPDSYGTIITGLPTTVRVDYDQFIYPHLCNVGGSTTSGGVWGANAIGYGGTASGWNSTAWTWPVMTNMPKGYYGQVGSDNTGLPPNLGGTGPARYTELGSVGPVQVFALVIVDDLSCPGYGWVMFSGKNTAHWTMHIRYRG